MEKRNDGSVQVVRKLVQWSIKKDNAQDRIFGPYHPRFFYAPTANFHRSSVFQL